MQRIAAIAGLGNPGDKYEDTRHNAGFWLVDELARRHEGQFRYERRFDADICKIEIAAHDFWLIKPQSFMNESGRPLRSFIDYYRVKPSELLVAHDEIDLPVAELRIKKAGGHGGHNGLRDTIACLGAEFARLRIGVGHPGRKSEVVSYVLKRANRAEQEALDAAIDRAAGIFPTLAKNGVDIAMNRLNRRRKAPKPDKEPKDNHGD